MPHLVDLSGISNIIEKQMDQISLITILSLAIVYFLLRPYYLKDIVNYEYKTIADILAFLFLSWVVSTVLGLILAMNLVPIWWKLKSRKSAHNDQRNFINSSDAGTRIQTGFFYVRIAYPKLNRSTTNHINMEEPGNQLIDLNYWIT